MRALAFRIGVNKKRQRTAKLAQGLSLLLVAIIFVCAGLTQMAQALPGDYSWQKAPTNLTGDQMPWKSIASSTDGTKLAATVGGGYIYTSADSGATWTAQTASGSRHWSSVASSADGTKLVAATRTGYVYTSIDGGASWVEQAAAGSRDWYTVASSADGTKLTAGAYGNGGGGYIYTSADSGATWTERTAAGSRRWISISSNDEGSKLAAVAGGGYIYTSADSGATWTERTAAGSRYWQPVASSADGTKLVAGARSGYIYTSVDSGATWSEWTSAGSHDWSSTTSSADGSKLAVTDGTFSAGGSIYNSGDSGATWIERTVTGERQWYSTRMSNDGTKLVVGVYGGFIYTSTDSGATWTERTGAGSRDWSAIASSSDGTKLVASAWGGPTYTSTDSGATWTERPSAGVRTWRSIASSSDGTKLVAVGGGAMYASVDSGITWIENTGAGARSWGSIASSADGTKLLAGVDGGSLYTSVDSGVTWSLVASLNSDGGWYSLAMTPDGTTLFAADAYGVDGDGGYAYISKDGGVTWQEQTSLGLRYWNDWASNTGAISADGQTIAIADTYGSDWNGWYGGRIYVTHNGGAHWQAQTGAGAREWTSITMSSDGSKLAAGVDGGDIHLGSLEGPATTTIAMPSLLAQDKDVTAAPSIAQASLAVTSSTCYTIAPGSVSTLGPDSLSAPEEDVSLLGGFAFSLSCATSGGTANTQITLGEPYTDLSKLRVYKRSGTGPLIDITDQITLTNEAVSGAAKTILRYNLTDGGSLDEDGTVNGTIVDPIYIGVAASGELASTGVSATIMVAFGALTMVAGVLIAARSRVSRVPVRARQ